MTFVRERITTNYEIITHAIVNAVIGGINKPEHGSDCGNIQGGQAAEATKNKIK